MDYSADTQTGGEPLQVEEVEGANEHRTGATADFPSTTVLVDKGSAEHAPTTITPPFPLAEPGEFYSGLWSGLPNYSCPYCGYSTLEGSGAIELHILTKIDQESGKDATTGAAGKHRHLKALELKK